MFVKGFYHRLSRSRSLTVLLLIAASLGLGVLSLRFAAVLRADEMFDSYFENHWIAFLNLLPCVWLALTLWFATQRAAVAFALSSLLVMGLSIASWFKLQFRNDPLMFEDLLLVKEAGNMSGRYQLFVTKSMLAALAVLLAAVLVLAFLGRARLPWKARLAGVLVLLLCLIPMAKLYTDTDIYTNKTENYDLINRWSTTQVYISKGFVYPFLYSVQSAIDTPPEGYDADEAAATLARYTDADIPENEKVDVIGIMLEAYADFSVYDQIRFNVDPYEEYHKLEEEGISGNLLTNIFAGGTVDTERCFLTGYCDLGSFRSPTNSYVRYFAGQGYTVTGSHPSYDWFYNRVNINANLGFESYNFLENHYGAMADGGIAMDRVLFPELINLHERHKAESGKPYFAFNVTYQGHGPYTQDKNDYGVDYVVPGVYTEESQNILNNYFGSIADTNAHLKEFFDHYRASEDPVVIVLFGDHKPWLGDGSSVYAELGIDLNFGDSEEGFRNYYTTRYLIWANDAAKQALGKDFQGAGRDLGPYFLMDELFRQCGWEGPAYMQATRACSETVPVLSVAGLYLENGVLTDTLTKDAELVRQYRCLEYYERKHFRDS